MLELNDQIARLERRSEQLCLHLHSMDKNSQLANDVRSDLLTILQTLAALKGRRQRMEATYHSEVPSKAGVADVHCAQGPARPQRQDLQRGAAQTR
jgi:hypothetical protein